MLDLTKPLELSDGTPASVVREYGGGTVRVRFGPHQRDFQTTTGKPLVEDTGGLPSLNGRTLRNVIVAVPPAVDLSSLSLPDDDAKRGEYPMADGLLDYFPNALAEVSKVSKIGNEQHNPGQPMHWARDKSTDHANKIMRHLVDRGRFDGRGVRHTARLAWRALAMLQDELEAEEGFPRSRASKTSQPAPAAA